MKTIPEVKTSDVIAGIFLFLALLILFGGTSFGIVYLGGFDITGSIVIGIISATTNLTFIFFVLMQFMNQNQQLEAQSELIKAQKAQYAPNLDYKLDKNSQEDFVKFGLRNEGHGPARDIELITRIKLRSKTMYHHKTKLKGSLAPGEIALEDREMGILSIDVNREILENLLKISKGIWSNENPKVEIALNYKDTLQNDSFEEIIVDNEKLSNFISDLKVEESNHDPRTLKEAIFYKFNRFVEGLILEILSGPFKSSENADYKHFYNVGDSMKKEDFRMLFDQGGNVE